MTDAPARILMIRPSALGDVCRSVPVLVSLRRAFPGAVIDWLVQDSFVDAVRAHPALSGVVPFPRRALGDAVTRLRLGSVKGWLDELRGRGYGQVFDMQGLGRSGFFALATRAPRRVGYANAREFGWLGYTERYPVEAGRHSVDRMLELLRLAGVDPVPDLRLYAPSEHVQAAARDPELSGRRYVVVAPTSRWAGKCWAPGRFAALCAALLERGVERVVLVGSSGERGQCGAVLDLAGRERRVLDRIGTTSVGQLMALIERSALVVANDSAALHIAVGFGRPILALFGPTRVDLVGPYGRAQDVIQHVRPGERMDHKDEAAGREMMDRIGVDEVVSRAAAALGAESEGRVGAPPVLW